MSSKPINTSNLTSEPTTRKRIYRSKIFIIYIATVCILITLVVLGLRSADAALIVSNDFLQAVQSNDTAKAYGLLTNDLRATLSQEEFKAEINKIAPKIKSQEKVIKRDISADTGKPSKIQFVYSTSAENINYTFTISLIKENSEWRIQKIELSTLNTKK